METLSTGLLAGLRSAYYDSCVFIMFGELKEFFNCLLNHGDE